MRPTGVLNFAHEDTRSRYNSHMQSPWIMLNYIHAIQIDSKAYNSSWNYPPRANWTYYAWSMWSVYSAMSLWFSAWGHETTVETYHEGICGATWPRFEHFGSQLWSLWSWKLVGLTCRGASPLPFSLKRILWKGVNIVEPFNTYKAMSWIVPKPLTAFLTLKFNECWLVKLQGNWKIESCKWKFPTENSQTWELQWISIVVVALKSIPLKSFTVSTTCSRKQDRAS